jgi:hypothetical protein
VTNYSAQQLNINGGEELRALMIVEEVEANHARPVRIL